MAKLRNADTTLPAQTFNCNLCLVPQVAAGSVVLRNLPAQVVAAGVPAKIIGVATEGRPSETVDQNLEHVRYHSSKASNGNGNGNGNGRSPKSGEGVKGLDDKRGGSAVGGAAGARKGGSAAGRRTSVGVRGIEEKKRSFL